MTGEVEIAFIVAETVLGESGAFIVSLLLSGVLISTVSAMIMAGPRALQRLGQDYRGFAWLGKTNEGVFPRMQLSSWDWWPSCFCGRRRLSKFCYLLGL